MGLVMSSNQNTYCWFTLSSVYKYSVGNMFFISKHIIQLYEAMVANICIPNLEINKWVYLIPIYYTCRYRVLSPLNLWRYLKREYFCDKLLVSIFLSIHKMCNIFLRRFLKIDDFFLLWEILLRVCINFHRRYFPYFTLIQA